MAEIDYEFNDSRKDASAVTKEKNTVDIAAAYPEYYAEEVEDVAELERHFILKVGDEDILREDGTVWWGRTAQSMLTHRNQPDTVNPYLWQQYQNGYSAGVLKMAEGFYAVYGVDTSPIGFARSKNGWILQDAGGSMEGAELALALVEKALGEKVRDNIVAVIYSHTHTDHLGGGSLLAGKDTTIIAPAEFEQSLVDDNLYAGVPMSRRLFYQCGLYLNPDEKGRVSIGLSSNLGVRGSISYPMPNLFIEKDGTIEVDGLKLTFVLAPNTETRAHMVTYFEDYKVLYLGDVGVGTIHNTYTMRGAPVRDANYWGSVFYKLSNLFGDRAEAVYHGHGLPHFKSERKPGGLKKYLLDNAAAYKFTNDQAMLLANKGLNIEEIGQRLEIPEEISRTWYTRGHYGSYSFNARGTVQKYLGFYDGNPVNLLPLDKRELAKKLVEYIGSEELVLEKAVRDFKKGEYQWVATITNYLVYLNPENRQARYLCADAFEQLGYQAENALWRNAYLAAAVDLRHPEIEKNLNIKAMDNSDVIPHTSVALLLDHLGINFDGSAGIALHETFCIRVQDADHAQTHRILVYKGTIFHDEIAETDDVIAELSKDELYRFATHQLDSKEEQALPAELKRIYAYVTDTRQYRHFSLVEP
jgi:alkyl sulfatase BDS1-like metallo-beta-lactamase superfamily hydrolase